MRKGACDYSSPLQQVRTGRSKPTDIKSSFLQGKELDIYIIPSKESNAPQNVIWKLKYNLYGLKDEARNSIKVFDKNF